MGYEEKEETFIQRNKDGGMRGREVRKGSNRRMMNKKKKEKMKRN